MRHYVKKTNIFISALAVLSSVAATLFAGCTREGDSTLGYEFLPDNQRSEMRHKSFKSGVVRSFDKAAGEYRDDAGHRFFETHHFRTDSLVSSNLQTGYLGKEFDTEGIFGTREAGFASEFLFTSTVDDEGFGYLPIFDSLQLILSISESSGDTLRPVRYTVYEVTKSIKESMKDAAGTEDDDDDDSYTAYIDHDMSDLYDASKPLFTFVFPDPDKGIYPSSADITLTPVDLNGDTWDFVRRLMLAGDLNDGWDGYADDTAVYESDDDWVEAFKGIYIKPEDDLSDGSEGSMFAVDLASTGMKLYGRNRNPEEPRLIKDTVSMSYVFYDANATSAGNQSINYVKHDYAGSALETAMNISDRKREEGENGYAWRDDNRRNHVKASTVYVEGMGGALTELYLTDDFLNELRNINTEEGFSHASINQALMYIYIDGSDYDWTMLNPSVMTPLLDASLSRIGMYTSVENLTPIADYNYYYEANYGTSLNYDGYLKRSLGCYVMDISSYIQRLKNYVDELNPDAEEDFIYEFDSNDTDKSHVARTIYLAPEAYSLYTLKRSKLQGMEDENFGNASIRIELTYTMIK